MAAPETAQRVRDAIGPVVAAAGLQLEDVEVVRAGAHSVVRVSLDAAEDAPADLDLDAVAAVSTAVSGALDDADVVPGQYTLEVSSRGVGRPLTERRHFTRNRGRLLQLRLADGGTLRGRLTDVERTGEDGVLLVTPETPGEKGRPARTGTPVRLALADVRDATVEVELTGHEAGGDADDADVAGDDTLDGPEGRED